MARHPLFFPVYSINDAKTIFRKNFPNGRHPQSNDRQDTCLASQG